VASSALTKKGGNDEKDRLVVGLDGGGRSLLLDTEKRNVDAQVNDHGGDGSVAGGVFAAAAYARTFTCTDLPCYGTSDHDVINERPAAGTPDEIFGRAGADNINAGISFLDEDILHGQNGNDRLNTDDDDPLDTVYGGKGTDTCRVDEGDEYFGCEAVYVDGAFLP
jgi:hypothetical protein